VKLAFIHLEADFAALFAVENYLLYSLGANLMRTFTANILVISAQTKDTTITGTAIDGDIAIDFAVANTDVNQRLFVSEAQLVVTGKFRVAKAIATIGAWISSVIAVVSIPAPVEIKAIESEVIVEAIEVEVVAETEVLEPEVIVEAVDVEVIEPVLTPAQKRAATLAAKRAKAESELVHV
jgi:hypothetical protein